MADELKASPTYPGQGFLGGLGQVAERLGISLQEAMGILAKEGNSPIKAFIGNLLLADPLKSAGTALQDYTGTPRDITPESPYSRLLSGAGQTTRLDPRALDVAMFAQPIASVGAKTAPKITKSLIDEALTPRSGRRAQEGAVKLGGGNWSSRGVDDAMRPLKKEYALTPAQVIAARHERLGGIGLADAKSAAGLNTYGEPLSRRELLGEMSTMRGYKGTHRERLEQLLLLPHELAVDTWVDKQMRKYLTDKLATPDDSIRIAADAWPAQQTKLLEAKQAQIDKAVAARDKLQIERNVAPEVLTRSNAHIRELETEKRLIKYRKGLHGGEFEEYANDNPFAELTPADMSDMNLAGRRTDAGMPAEGFGKTPMGKAWENTTDEAIISTPAGKAAALRWFPDDTKWIKKLPRDTPIYNFNPNSTGTPLGFSHLVDEIRNAVSPDSTLPAQFRIDAKDLSKWTVPQMSEHVDKINAWRKVQSEDAINASREGIPVHKEYPEGYQWLAVPDLQTNPEALKYATEVGCQGGWCTEGADTATRYGSGNNRLYVLHNPSGNAVAQIATKPGGKVADPVFDAGVDFSQQAHDDVRRANPRLNEESDDYMHAVQAREQALAQEWNAKQPVNAPPRIAEIKGLQNKMPEPEDIPFIQDFVRSGKWSDVSELHNAQMVSMDRAVKLSKWLQEQGIAHPRYIPEQEYSTHLENFNRAQTPKNGMKRGGPVNQDAMQMAVWNKAIRKQVGGEPTQAEIDAATLPARMNPNFQRQAEKIKSQGERDFPIMGPLELGSQVLSGTAAMIPATLYGVYKDITSRKAGDAYSGQAAGNQAVKDALEMLTYQPRTAPGQDLSETFARILEASKLPPYFGHLGTPHVVPGTGRLLMENATAPRDPFFAGPSGRQRGAVKPVDLSRRGFFGLPKEAMSTENALVPTNTSITPKPITPELTSISPLDYLTQKIADTPMSRRDFLEQTAKTAASQALKVVLPNVVQNALKDIGLKETLKVENPLADIERSLKRYFVTDAADAWQEGNNPFAVLEFVEKYMTNAQKLEINKAKNLVSEDSPNWMSSEDMSKRQVNRVMKKLSNFSKIVDEHIDDVPLNSILSPDDYKIDLEDLQNMGHALTPEIVERIKSTDWGPDIFNDFDLTKLRKAKGGLVNQDAMRMAVWNKQLRKQHG